MKLPLSARLRELAALVPSGEAMADIGCDHGLLCAYLLRSNKVPRIVASDRSANALAGAARTLAPELEAADPRVSLRTGDGLKTLRPGECPTVVVAGMGVTPILKMLPDAKQVAEQLGVRRLILQPNHGFPRLREFRLGLWAQGFDIVEEVPICEAGRAYLAAVVQPRSIQAPAPTQREDWDSIDLEVGPRLRHRHDHPRLGAWLDIETRRAERALQDAVADPDPRRTTRLRSYLRSLATVRRQGEEQRSRQGSGAEVVLGETPA